MQPGSTKQERLSTVLDPTLAEHVRVRSFQQRLSKSAFLRVLVEADAVANPVRVVVDRNGQDGDKP